MQWLDAAQLAVGFTLVAAGVAKLRTHSQFADDVIAFGIPPRHSGRVAWTVTLIELTIGLGLLLEPIASQAVPIASSLLFLLFAIASLRVLLLGVDASCGCFGGDSQFERVSWFSFGRALGLAIVSALLAWAPGYSYHPGLPELVAGTLLAIMARFASLLPLIAQFHRSQPTLEPTGTRRLSYRHVSLTTSLFASEIPSPIGSGME